MTISAHRSNTHKKRQRIKLNHDRIKDLENHATPNLYINSN